MGKWGGNGAEKAADGICRHLTDPRAPLFISQPRLQPLVQPWPTFKLIICFCWSETLTLPPVSETCPFRPFTWHFTVSKIRHFPKNPNCLKLAINFLKQWILIHSEILQVNSDTSVSSWRTGFLPIALLSKLCHLSLGFVSL